MNTILKFNISGRSINELCKVYGTGAKGFYNSSWYENEDFANDKPVSGIYEISFGEETRDKTFKEQQEMVSMMSGIEAPFQIVHPAVMCEALLLHFKETGKYLCADYCVRTSLLDSGGYRVVVGDCDADGVSVNDYWGGRRHDDIGVGASRKFSASLDPRNLDSLASLELRVHELERWREKLVSAWNGN